MNVVLLHGFPLDERMWEGQREILAGFDVHAPRLYRLGTTVEDWARAVLAQVEGELVAVGASMGGYVGLAMARLAPERVRGLVLVGSRAGADLPERRLQRDEIAALLRERGVEAWYRQSGNPAPERWVLDHSAEDLARALEALRDRPDATDVVRTFAGPLLLVVGTEDELLPLEEARAIVESAPDGRLEAIEGAGHFVNLDAPDRFNAALRGFLSRWT
jgi:pimeloyl-ACP methyl ester carboxylesterase